MDGVTPFAVGDVLQLKGPSVPAELWSCYWRVLAISPSGTTELSAPFEDEACRVPYRARDPRATGCWKRAYPSAKAAKLANRHASWRVKTYWCPVCAGYHVSNGEKLRGGTDVT